MKTASRLDRALREVHRGRLSPVALIQTLLRVFNEAGVVGLGTLAYQNDPLSLAMGGTAATTAAGARTNLGLGTVAVENTPLAVAKGGTGVATSTGATNVVLSDSPTIVTPTIASFANATHAHQTAAGGGTLDAVAIATGTLATARLGSGAASASTFLRGDQSWAAAGVNVKVGQTTIAAATTGNVAITGVGFLPKIVIIFASTANTALWSIGAGTASTARWRMSADDANVTTSGTTLIVNINNAGIIKTADLVSLDADGFTLNWTNTGSITWTTTYSYICIG